MCNIVPNHSHFGNSLLPVISNRTVANRQYVYSEGGRLKDELHCNETNGKDPHLFNPYYPRLKVQKDSIAHTKATMIRSSQYKYIHRLYEEDEFYDLENDPEEKDNNIHSSVYSFAITDMKMEMLKWYQTTCDIVPFEQDERFNYDIIWNRVKLLCPPELKEEVQEKIHNGADMFMLLEWIKNKNVSSKEV
jgi:hypothetical protein